MDDKVEIYEREMNMFEKVKENGKKAISGIFRKFKT